MALRRSIPIEIDKKNDKLRVVDQSLNIARLSDIFWVLEMTDFAKKKKNNNNKLNRQFAIAYKLPLVSKN